MYQFRNNHPSGCRYSVYVQRFVTDAGTTRVLEWFHTMQEAQTAVDEMIADGRFFGISSYSRSLEAAQ